MLCELLEMPVITILPASRVNAKHLYRGITNYTKPMDIMYKTNRRHFYIILFVFTIVFYINKILFFSSGTLENLFSYVSYPILNLQNKIVNPIKNLSERFTTISELKTKLETETIEKERLQEENIMLKSSISHLEHIVEFAGFKERYNLKDAITSQIILKQISEKGQFFYIDKGTNHSITKDMVAIYKNCLIGRVIEVFSTKSKVVFITDNSCKVAAFCFKTGTIGIYEGINEYDNAQLSFVSHLDKLEKDDLVISNGEGLIFPKGLALGKVESFKKINQVQYEVNIKPMLDIKKLSYCCLIKK